MEIRFRGQFSHRNDHPLLHRIWGGIFLQGTKWKGASFANAGPQICALGHWRILFYRPGNHWCRGREVLWRSQSLTSVRCVGMFLSWQKYMLCWGIVLEFQQKSHMISYSYMFLLYHQSRLRFGRHVALKLHIRPIRNSSWLLRRTQPLCTPSLLLGLREHNMRILFNEFYC